MKNTLFKNNRLDLSDYSTRANQNTLSFKYLMREVLQNETILCTGLRYAKDILYIRNYNKLPIAVRLTVNLLLHLSLEDFNHTELGIELVRGLNQIVDMNQKTRNSQSFLSVLYNLGIHPDMCDLISEIRHSIIHKTFPSNKEIEICVVYLISFLKENFWETTLYKNIERFNESKLEWILVNVNKTFQTNFHTSQFTKTLPKKALVPQGLTDLEKFESKIDSILRQNEYSVDEMIYIGKKLKIKNYKAILLSKLLAKLANSPENSNLNKIIIEYIQKHINISEMRNALAYSALRKGLIALKINSLVYDELKEIVNLISYQFKALFNKRKLGSLFNIESNSKLGGVDDSTCERMIKTYSSEPLIDQLCSYYTKNNE